MTVSDGHPGPLAQSARIHDSSMGDDPLLGSWLRRALPPATNTGGVASADGRRSGRQARTEQLAMACALHSSMDATAWPPATEPIHAVDCMWNSVRAVSIMRRSLALARSRDAQPESPGGPPDNRSPHTDMLAALEAETWGAFLLAFLVVELNGRLESGEIDGQQRALLRLVAPVAALGTGRQAVTVAGEAIMAPGENAQPEDTGLSQLLRDALGLAKCAGGPAVLVLEDARQADLHDGLAALMGRTSGCLRGLKEPRLIAAGRQAVAALERAALWLESGKDRKVLQAGSRRLAMTLARGLELALLCEHAQWMLDHDDDRRGFAAALRYSRLPVDLVHEVDVEMDGVLLAPPGTGREGMGGRG